MLAKESASLKSTAAFLSKRGVDVFVASTLQDVVDRMSEGWSKYLLLSVNYPHPKIDLVPQLLAKSFAAEVVVFAEQSDRKSSSRLTNAKTKHVIFGTPSGPVVLMRLKHMHKGASDSHEATTEQHSSGEQRSGSDGGESGGMRISGASAEGNDAIRLRGGSEPAMQGDTAGRSVRDGSGESAAARFARALREAKVEDAGVQIDDVDLDDILEAAEERKAKTKQHAIVQKGLRGKKFFELQPRAPTAKMKQATAEAIRQGRLKSAVQSSPDEKFAPLRLGPNFPHSAREALLHDGIVQPTPSQVLERCARFALHKCLGRPFGERALPSEYKTASVLVIGTKMYEGSVIIAIGKGEIDHKELVRDLETEFIAQLTSSGIEIGIGEVESFQVLPATNVQSAFTAAEFATLSRAAGGEAGMAFLSIKPKAPFFIPTRDGMIQIDVTDIQPEVTLTFDVFLFLAINNKYLRFLKPGSVLSFAQADRLRADPHHQALYLNKDDTEAFRQHATMTSLNSRLPSKKAA